MGHQVIIGLIYGALILTIHYFLQQSKVHPSWFQLLEKALLSVDQDYLDSLIQDKQWLPGADHIFAAFRQDLNNLSYVLFGESPYPRKSSSVGIAFLDGMVTDLWSDKGLSKAVNRATSLRNIIKCMLVAEGLLDPALTTQESISQLDKTGLVSSIDELFANLMRAGFLLLNATPVLHPQRKPIKESRFWNDFNRVLLEEIHKARGENPPLLVLWGKIAKTITAFEISRSYKIIQTEHPYNISFISNPISLQLFKQLNPLAKR